MSIAPRPAKWNSHSTDWSGHPALLGHRQSASPSSRTSGVPHEGHFFGIFHLRAPFDRFARTGPTISGITSPARRTIPLSPLRTSLRRGSSSFLGGGGGVVAPPPTTRAR